jgi:hypothetical protein
MAPDDNEDLLDAFDNPLIGVAGTVASFYAAQKNAEWQSSITAQLNQISRTLRDVLQTLKDLKIWINEALEASVSNAWSTTIDSIRMSVDGMMVNDGLNKGLCTRI